MRNFAGVVLWPVADSPVVDFAATLPEQFETAVLDAVVVDFVLADVDVIGTASVEVGVETAAEAAFVGAVSQSDSAVGQLGRG